MYTLYILLCDKNTYYVGITADMQLRLRQHEIGESFYTKRFSNVDLVYTEYFNTKIEAETRERQIKGWSRAKKTALINDNKKNLKTLSKKKS